MKDIEDVRRINGVIVELTHDPATIILILDNHHRRPSKFSITVPRFYPHAHPIIKCLDLESYCQFVNSEGYLIHVNVRENWSGVCSLRTIIDVLLSI